jgi:predicted ABC-type ATPase
MVYVALDNVETSIARVRERVAAGGHDVPEVKIRERWERSLDNLAVFAPHLDVLRVLDNSDSEPTLVAYKSRGAVVVRAPYRLPEITKRLA